MAPSEWNSGPPLYHEVRSFLRVSLKCRDTLHGGLAYSSKCSELMTQKEQRGNFRAGLSRSQIHSWKILQHWWANDILVRANQWVGLTDERQLRNSIGEYESETRGRSMAQLWINEYVPIELLQSPSYGKSIKLEECQAWRWSASNDYARHRLAKSMVQSLANPSIIGPQPLEQFPTVLGATPESCPWLKLKEDSLHVPQFIWDVARRCTVSTAKMSPPPFYLAVSHTWGRWRTNDPPQSVRFVPWRVPCNSRFNVGELPYMLRRLPFRVDYIWLDLLCIPQGNEKAWHESVRRQEISRQASIFTGAACAIAWLNDSDSWHGLRKVLRWYATRYLKLSNRALQIANPVYVMDVTEGALEGILRNVGTSVDVDMGLCEWSWDTEGRGEGSMKVSTWFTSLWTLQEVILRPDMMLCNRNFEMLTASEDCHVTLDMINSLVEAFEGPELADSNNPLQAFMYSNPALRGVLTSPSLWSKAPRSVSQLKVFCMTIVRLNEMSATPAMILDLASSRGCTGFRAEAIMSAVGATDWYEIGETMPDLIASDEMLFGYPFAFIEELRRKVKGKFFLSGNFNWSERDGMWPEVPFGGIDSSIGSRATYGTMLPFPSVPDKVMVKAQERSRVALEHYAVVSPDSEWACEETFSTRLFGYPYSWHDHPAVGSWRLYRNGNVRMESAAVEFSSLAPHAIETAAGRSDTLENDRVRHEQESTYLFVAVAAPKERMSKTPRVTTTKLLEDVCYSGDVYAVCVGEYTDEFDDLFRAGVLLGAEYPKPSRYFIRIGYYEGKVSPESRRRANGPLPSQRLDWIVL